MMEIFSGASCGSLTHLACDDDFCGGAGLSRITLNVSSGTQYVIRIGGWAANANAAGATGPMTLVISQGN